MIWLLGFTVVVGLAVVMAWAWARGHNSGLRAGYVVGHKSGHDRVVVWMLENGATPDAWNPANEWCDGVQEPC